MALHSAPADKLISDMSLSFGVVAPTGDGAQGPGQAAQFTLGKLIRSDLQSTPTAQFHAWFKACSQPSPLPSSAQVLSSTSTSTADSPSPSAHVTPAVSHPEACVLSTASLPSGRVSSRVVYLKELDSAGHFVIYSNFGTSRKAADLATNPHVSLVFWWEPVQRQVRIEGVAQRLSAAESQVYFDTRARGSRIGAWASRQSQVLDRQESGAECGAEEGEGNLDDGRAQLDGWVREVEQRFEGQDKIPVPEFWGGLRIIPDHFEFWQGRESRLHDRFVYDKDEQSGEWKVMRLSP
ncbi:Pyridoxamine 5'-phosphate oxidase [Ceratocystis lukuohia]|uniref:pyridoxal 5'-phosphate synthase n=1 Tax=Ceratocystis lukuohia TaxID=2019550 RepID=A0ABR4MAG6_9PEZI